MREARTRRAHVGPMSRDDFGAKLANRTRSGRWSCCSGGGSRPHPWWAEGPHLWVGGSFFATTSDPDPGRCRPSLGLRSLPVVESAWWSRGAVAGIVHPQRMVTSVPGSAGAVFFSHGGAVIGVAGVDAEAGADQLGRAEAAREGLGRREQAAGRAAAHVYEGVVDADSLPWLSHGCCRPSAPWGWG